MLAPGRDPQLWLLSRQGDSYASLSCASCDSYAAYSPFCRNSTRTGVAWESGVVVPSYWTPFCGVQLDGDHCHCPVLFHVLFHALFHAAPTL